MPKGSKNAKLKEKFHKSKPATIKAKPNKTFSFLNFKKGTARIIENPIKCKTPNQTVSCGKSKKVIKVTSKPKKRIFKPLFKKCLALLPLEKLKVKETPTRKMKTNAAVLPTKSHKPALKSNEKFLK